MKKIVSMFSVSMFAMAVMGIAPSFSGQAKQKPGKAKPPVKTDPVSYTKEIKPLFDKYCVGCHNVDLKKGGVLLETYEDLKKGGNNGDLLVPGKSADSLLYKTLLGKDALIMPPKNNIGPMPKEIELIKKWIDEGAKNDAAPAEKPGEKKDGK